MPGRPFSIRAAAANDLDGLLRLYRQLNPADPVLDAATARLRLDAILAQPGMTIYLGMTGETAASTATLSVIPNLTAGGASYGLIENVVTDMDQRNRGHGRAVMDHVVAAAWEAGCYKVMLLTGSQDAATHRFYFRCGFVPNKTGYQIRKAGFPIRQA